MSRTLRAALMLSVALALLGAGVAWAHADLVRSNPAANATLDTAPARIVIDFSEPLEPAFSRITVFFEDGTAVDGGDSAIAADNPRQLSVSLADTRQGTYVVSWRVLSAVDGHITAGAFVFSVGKPLNTAVNTDLGGAVTSPLDMLARALTFVGQALLAGLVLFRWVVWRPALKSAEIDAAADERAVALNGRGVWLALALAAAGTLLTLLAQSALAEMPIGLWLGTRVGRVWIGRVATLIAIGIFAGDFARAGRGTSGRGLVTDGVVAWLGGQALFLTSLTSHSAAITQPPVLPLATDFVHLLATSVWVGGLAQLALVVPRVAAALNAEDRAWLWLKVVVHFSTVAALALGAIILSGAYLSLLHVGSWPALLSTAYGRALLFKVGLAGVAMLIGAYNLLVTKPQLDRAIDQPERAPGLQRRFRRVVAAEALVGVLVLASAGILTDLPRSKDPQPQAPAQALTLTTRADSVDAALTLDPARTGLANYALRLSADGRPLTDASQVTLRFTYLTRNVGTASTQAALAADGAFVATGPYVSLPGDWQIEAAVRRPGAFDVFAAYRVKVNLDGHISAAGQTNFSDEVLRWLTVYGLPFGGVVAIGLGLLWLVMAFKAARSTWSQIVLCVPALIAVPIGLYSVVTFLREQTPGLALSNPFLPDEASLAAGQQLFQANCETCHGPRGRGDGPQAATLGVRPPDYGSGHLDIHTDGDIFYWIQNGPSPTSLMPAFKDKLIDEELWHLVNYVRRLRNEAGATDSAASANAIDSANTPEAAPPVVLQPYTPPTFIADDHGASLPITPTGEVAALALLAQADAAMNALRSLSEAQQVSDNSGRQLHVTFDFNAPDRMQYEVRGGRRAIQIGEDDYQPAPDGTWFKNVRGTAFVWPAFAYAQVAQQARSEPPAELNGQPVTVVVFDYNGYAFRLWLEADSHRILRYALDGADVHVRSDYSAFDAAPQIEPPVK